MSTTKDLISQLDLKVDTLLSELDMAKEKRNALGQELATLNQQLTAKDEELVELKSEIDRVKKEKEEILNAQPRNVETDRIKFRITELVKEIDNCISLLKV